MNRFEQFDALAEFALDLGLTVKKNNLRNEYRIGRKWYYSVFDASCAMLSAYEKAGIKIPDELRERPTELR